MVAPTASPGIAVAVIDGPYDAVGLADILARRPIALGQGTCDARRQVACNHGTFVMGLLGARRDAVPPGMCPECTFLHVPLFVDENAPWARVSHLAAAINAAVFAGARLINLSLAVVGDGAPHLDLGAALDHAEANGVVVVVAAGNQGRAAQGQLLTHPACLPVVAVTRAAQGLPDSNFGPAILRHGVAALGHRVRGYAAGGRPTVMSGSSAAAAVATGIIARLWSIYPDADATEIRAAIAAVGPRHGSIPPLLDRNRVEAELRRRRRPSPHPPASRRWSEQVILQGDTEMAGEFELPGSAHRGGDVSVPSGQAVVPAHGLGGCSCGGVGGQCSCGHGEPATRFIYVLGTVDIRFPDPSIAEELQTVAQTGNIEQGADEPLRHWYHRVLSLPSSDGSLAARYVARQLCWILKVEGQVAYQLSLRDMADLPDLISCLGRAEPEDQYHHDDLDLIIGTSSLVPAEPCQGIVCPVLRVDQLVTFRKETLVDWCKTLSNPGTKAPPKRKAGQSKLEAPGPDPSKLFRMLVQSADNLGDRDEWRALNYLAVRYKRIYEIYAAMADDYDLDSVKVGTSRLSRGKHIVDPIFAFRNKQTGVVQKFFVRVDVGHLFPMIVSHVAEYFDR